MAVCSAAATIDRGLSLDYRKTYEDYESLYHVQSQIESFPRFYFYSNYFFLHLNRILNLKV